MPFPVTCPACGKSFSISDEIYEQKIKGRVVSVKCKQCQGAIRVDGTGRTSVRAEAPVPAPAPAGVPSPEGTAAADPLAPPPIAEAPAPPQPPDPSPAPAPAARTATSEGSGARTVSTSTAREPLPKATGLARHRAGGGSAVLNNARAPAAAPAGLTSPTLEAAPVAAAAPVPEVAAPATPPASPPAPSPAVPPVAPAAAPAPVATAPVPVLFAVDSPDGDRELTAEQIGREIAAGTVNAETLVWRDGMPEWLEVKKVPELATFLKKPDPPKPPAAKPAAAPTGRFRPRQPTLPMGALPDRAGAPKAEATKPEPAPRAPMLAPLSSTRDTKGTGSLGARIPFIDPVPSDDEPTVLRSPDAVAALLSAATEERDDHTPVPPRLAAQLAGNRATPEAAGPAPLPPFGSRSGTGASARTAIERPAPSAPIGISASPAPSSERRPPGSGPKVSPIDTFRESPEAKRAWFPEPVPGQPPPASPSREVSPSPPLFANVSPPVESPPPPFVASPPSPPPQPIAPVFQQPVQRPSPPPTAPPFAPPSPPPFAGPTPTPMVAPPATSPAFASPPNFGSSGTAASVVLDDAALRPKRGKAGLWIVLLLLVIVIAGVAFVMLGGLKKPASLPPAPTPATAAAEQPPAAAPPEAPPSTAPIDTPNAPATETAAATTGGAPAPATGNRDPLAEPTSPPSTNSGFADLFAAGAKRAAGGRFDPKLAKAAFDALLMDASKCRERGGPTGVTRVTLTFAPAGTVSSAVAQDVPIAGTATAACISQVFKRATIPPFTGSPGTITERISIQ